LQVTVDVVGEDSPYCFDDRVHDQVTLAAVEVAGDFQIRLIDVRNRDTERPTIFGLEQQPLFVEHLHPVDRLAISTAGDHQPDDVEVQLPQSNNCILPAVLECTPETVGNGFTDTDVAAVLVPQAFVPVTT
jgi:hypothetical protein